MVLNKRGLAGAVGADEAEDLALAHGEGDILQRDEPAEADGDVLKPQHGRLPLRSWPNRPNSPLGATRIMPASSTPSMIWWPDRQQLLGDELVEQVDQHRACDRPENGAVAAEDRGDDRQHRPIAGEGVVGLEEVDDVGVHRAEQPGDEGREQQHPGLQQGRVDADDAGRVLALGHGAQRGADMAALDGAVDQRRRRRPARRAAQ